MSLIESPTVDPLQILIFSSFKFPWINKPKYGHYIPGALNHISMNQPNLMRISFINFIKRHDRKQRHSRWKEQETMCMYKHAFIFQPLNRVFLSLHLLLLIHINSVLTQKDPSQLFSCRVGIILIRRKEREDVILGNWFSLKAKNGLALFSWWKWDDDDDDDDVTLADTRPKHPGTKEVNMSEEAKSAS